jgi:hypothetical protein
VSYLTSRRSLWLLPGANAVSKVILNFMYDTGPKLDTSTLGSLHRQEAICWDGHDARSARTHALRKLVVNGIIAISRRELPQKSSNQYSYTFDSESCHLSASKHYKVNSLAY